MTTFSKLWIFIKLQTKTIKKITLCWTLIILLQSLKVLSSKLFSKPGKKAKVFRVFVKIFLKLCSGHPPACVVIFLNSNWKADWLFFATVWLWKNRCEKQPISFSIAVQKMTTQEGGWPEHSFKNILTKTRKTFAFLPGLENSFELKTLRDCKRIISVQHNVIFLMVFVCNLINIHSLENVCHIICDKNLPTLSLY